MHDLEADGLPTPRRYWAAAAIWLAMAMSVLDSSIANVALPTIAHDVGASPESSIWVVNAYQIAITMLLLPIAALGEILGYRRVYGAGLAIFVVASLACTLAQGLTTLALARFVQGFGAAAVMSINGALVRFTYPKATLGRGIGYNALVVAIASAAGPSVAAAILAFGSWRWLFAVNVPLGLLSLLIGQRCLPSVAGTGGRFGIVSSLLNAAMFAAAFLAASDAAHGKFDARTAAELAAAVLMGVLLVRRVRHQTSPLIPLDLLVRGGNDRARRIALLSAGDVRLQSRRDRPADHALATRGCHRRAAGRCDAAVERARRCPDSAAGRIVAGAARAAPDCGDDRLHDGADYGTPLAAAAAVIPTARAATPAVRIDAPAIVSFNRYRAPRCPAQFTAQPVRGSAEPSSGECSDLPVTGRTGNRDRYPHRRDFTKGRAVGDRI